MKSSASSCKFDLRQGLKSVAIYSVITAHITLYTCTLPFCDQFSRFLILFGGMGVGTFFALLGLDWHSRNKKTFLRMLRQDVSHYIVPSVFSGLVIYLSLLLRKGDPGINLVDFLLGNGSGSYLWFVPMFLCLRYLSRVPMSGGLFGLLLPVSFVIYYQSQPYSVFDLNPHLNVFYWLPYVFVGRCSGWLLRFVQSLQRPRFEWLLGIFCSVTPFVILLSCDSIPIAYFDLSVLFASASFFFGILVLFACASSVPSLARVFKTEFLKFLSSQTLFIYVWHMLIAGLASRLLGHNLFILLGPPAIIAFLFIAFTFIQNLSQPLLFVITGIKPPMRSVA